MSTKNLEMGKFVSQLMKQDKSNFILGKTLNRFYFIMMGVFLFLMVLNPFTSFEIYHRISGLLFVLTFAWFALIFGKYQKYFRDPDYSEPTAVMLQKVIARYKLSLKHFLQIIPPVIFTSGALFLTANGKSGFDRPLTSMLVVPVVFLIIATIAMIAGYQSWRIKQKPLYDFARETLKDLQS